MQRIVTYATGIRSNMKSVLIYIFNFGYLSSEPSIFKWARMWKSVVIFRNQKGPASENVVETLHS
jgi:hypothetical protein